MKAIVIDKPGKIGLKEVAMPQPGFVRILVKAAAICATDLEVLDGNIAANYPLTPGHEWSGIESDPELLAKDPLIPEFTGFLERKFYTTMRPDTGQ